MAIGYFGSLKAALDNLDTKAIQRLADMARKADTIWLCGNGGSFANAQHWSCDLQKVANKQALALGNNQSLFTAYANDELFAVVFQVELQQWAKPGDLLICLSCSGSSTNIRAALSTAHELGLQSVLLTGTVNDRVAHADHIIRVWSQDYGVIEDCHMAIGHWLAKALQ